MSGLGVFVLVLAGVFFVIWNKERKKSKEPTAADNIAFFVGHGFTLEQAEMLKGRINEFKRELEEARDKEAYLALKKKFEGEAKE